MMTSASTTQGCSVAAIVGVSVLCCIAAISTMGSTQGVGNEPRSLVSMGTGTPVFTGLQVSGGNKLNTAQMNLKFAENDQAKLDWEAAGPRGVFLGAAPTPQVSKLVEKAAADCGQDPNCICDWAGSPRRCLFSYCCGHIAHQLGQRRGDYITPLPSPQQVLDAHNQAEHLKAWQDICSAEQDTWGPKCSENGVPAGDNRKQ